MMHQVINRYKPDNSLLFNKKDKEKKTARKIEN
jgi:hypothetical protein